MVFINQVSKPINVILKIIGMTCNFWSVLNSANLSKAAWGYEFKNQTKILNYELGVMFLPSFINVINIELFL